MRKIYLTLLTSLSINSYSQYITNNSTVANYTANLRHNGNLAIGDASITDNTIPFQIKYSASNKNIQFPIRNGSGGYDLTVAGGNWTFDPIARAGDGILRIMGGKDFIFSSGSSGNPNGLAGQNGVQRYVFSGQYDSKTLSIYNTGKVTIGTDKYDLSGYRLFVKDGIKTERLKVEVATTNQWADFVFNDDYNLRPLNEVKKFIQSNKHLPEIPSADEIVKDGGIEQGELNAKLLQKIEELTLYLIQQNEKIQELEKQIQSTKK